jgi:hypothetical protein
MAAIQNDRDILLQAASPRVVPILIPIEQVEGLGPALKRLQIKANATTFMGSSGTTSPATIVLTAEKFGSLSGTVTWSVVSGTATLTPSGDTCTVTGSTIVGHAVTVRARVQDGGVNYDAQIVLSRLGTLSSQEYVNLTTQVTGQLAMGNVTGYGALALLNQVDLNTQTVGALNGATQVTNLGTLAYANAIAANQIGAGTLAAGVVYAGVINADQVNSGSFSGRVFTGGNCTGGVFQTSQNTSEPRVHISGDTNGFIRVHGGPGAGTEVFKASSLGVVVNGVAGAGSIALSVGSTGAGIRIQAAQGNPAIILAQTNSLPAPVSGGIAYHSAYQFVFSNGAAWYTPAGGWTAVT